MTEEKPAEMRLLKKMDEVKVADTEGRQKRSSFLPFLNAMLTFIGGFGRVLKFIDDVVDWWNNLS
jgi:hypothetical protein